jgi:hypothetical protein
MGMTEAQTLETLRAWNPLNLPGPLDDKELVRTTHSIGRREAQKRASGGATEGHETPPRARRAPTHVHRSALLEGLNQRLGVVIESISKTTGDTPIWDFDMGNEILVRMTTSQLFQQRKFQEKFLEQTGFIPNKDKKWDQVVQVISDISDQIDAGEEATTTGALRLAVRDYLANNPPEPWTDEKRPPYGYPFYFKSAAYLFKDELYKFLVNTKWIKITPQDLAQRMRNLHMSPKNPSVFGFRPRVWEVPADLLPKAKEPKPAQDEQAQVVVPFKQQGTF